MEENSEWMKPYKKRAETKTLQFNNQRKVMAAPKPPIIIKQKGVTELIGNNDDFFDGAMPGVKDQKIDYTGGDFFEVKEEITKDVQGNFFN